jgi:transcription initiation factor TFIIIB Brf1 subunit/transcription initiation factor TFIIB
MSDEIRLTRELTTNTYANVVGNKITVVKIENNVLMTAKEIAKLYGVSRPYITMRLHQLYIKKVLNKKTS